MLYCVLLSSQLQQPELADGAAGAQLQQLPMLPTEAGQQRVVLQLIEETAYREQLKWQDRLQQLEQVSVVFLSAWQFGLASLSEMQDLAYVGGINMLQVSPVDCHPLSLGSLFTHVSPLMQA
jgi:hypothetical protein